MANPMDKTDKQSPGVYRRRIGDALVTTINDGFLDISFEILRGAGLEDFQGLMRSAFRDGPPRLTVNAFVIQTDRNTILVDSGGGSTTVYSMGRLPENLRAAGFKPDDFDTVLVTHIHPDHTSGLLDTEGKPAFPRAEVVVHEDEITFWSDKSLRDGTVGRGDALSRFRRPGPRRLSRTVPSEPGRNGSPRRDATAASRPYPGTLRLPSRFCRRNPGDVGRHRARAGDPEFPGPRSRASTTSASRSPRKTASRSSTMSRRSACW